jgi:hypothetical protein
VWGMMGVSGACEARQGRECSLGLQAHPEQLTASQKTSCTCVWNEYAVCVDGRGLLHCGNSRSLQVGMWLVVPVDPWPQVRCWYSPGHVGV